MGNKQQQMSNEHNIRKSLKKIPFKAPNEKVNTNKPFQINERIKYSDI